MNDATTYPQLLSATMPTQNIEQMAPPATMTLSIRSIAQEPIEQCQTLIPAILHALKQAISNPDEYYNKQINSGRTENKDLTEDAVAKIIRKITDVRKIYGYAKDSEKYSSLHYDHFREKFNIFLNKCGKADLMTNNYSKTFSHMLCDNVLTYYHNYITSRGISDIQNITLDLETYFETRERY